MIFQEGNCEFEDMDFEILPHVLRANQPRVPCSDPPNIDFSWGFPDPWLLAYTDVVVPSLHRQDGHQYDGEIVLSHTYSVDEADKRVSHERKSYGRWDCTFILRSKTGQLYPVRLAMWRSSCRMVLMRITMTFWSFTFNVGAMSTKTLLSSAAPVNGGPDQKAPQMS